MDPYEKIFGAPGELPPDEAPRSGMQPISDAERDEPPMMPPTGAPVAPKETVAAQLAPDEPTTPRADSDGPRINPILGMFTQPRRVTRQILTEDPEQGVVFLAMLAGAWQAFNHASNNDLGDSVSFMMILLLGTGIGAATGVITTYLGGWTLHQACRILGGGADLAMTRSAMVWGSVPIIAAGFLWIPELAIFREEMFTSEMPRAWNDSTLSSLLFAFGGLEIILGVWGLVTMCKSVGEANGFSAWRALGAMFVSGFLIVALFVALAIGLAVAGIGLGAM